MNTRSDELAEQLPGRLEKALRELLGPDEVPIVKLKGAFKEALVCTDRRAIIVKAGMLTGQTFGSEAFQQPYSNIAGAQVTFHLMSGYFELNAGGMQNQAKHFWSNEKSTDPAKAPNCISLNSRAQAARFRQACSIILERVDRARNGSAPPSSSSSAFADLEALGRLRDSGVVTEEEFQAKKAELLARG